MPRHMSLIGYLYPPVAHNAGGWRHPFGRTDFVTADFYRHVARTLEDGRFDMVFMPDTQAIPPGGGSFEGATLRNGGQTSMNLEPLVVLATMAAVTEHIGLAATMSTSLLPPFHIARIMASLDHLSGGRAGWNIVTSSIAAEAGNFGMDALPPRELRYEIANEVVEACVGLWESWERDALILDKETGVFADPDRVTAIDYAGEHVSVAGPLNVPRSPQTRPLLMQAGSSEAGLRFAARWAEAVFTLQDDLDSMRAFRSDLRARAEAAGRDPDSVRIYPAVQPLIAPTRALAEDLRDYLASLVTLDVAVATVAMHTGLDLSEYPLHQPLKDVQLELGTRGSFDLLLRVGGERNLTLGEAAREWCTTELCPQLVGTPSDVADGLQELFEAEACDGFIITPVTLPHSFDEFTRSITPELQRRGLLRTEYPRARHCADCSASPTSPDPHRPTDHHHENQRNRT